MENYGATVADLKVPFDLTVTKSWERSLKKKHASISSNRKNQTYNPADKSKRKVHTRQSSILRKSKSKCETEVNFTNKKKSAQNQTTQKKTIKKKKNVDSSLRYSQNKLTNSKKQEERGNKKWPRKEMFHSTCFSRLMEPDLLSNQKVNHANSDYLHRNFQSSESLSKIYDRTRVVINSYQKKCQDLSACCNFYKKQLQKARNKISEMKAIHSNSSNSKHNNKRSRKGTGTVIKI